MSENHNQKADITVLKADGDADARLVGRVMPYGSILDEENPVVSQNTLLLNILKRMKEKYRNSERSMLQLRTWEARAQAGKARADEVFIPETGFSTGMLTTRRIIGLLTHPKALRTDERVKDALLIAYHFDSDYIDDDLARLVSTINRGGVTGDTGSKVKVLKHGGSAGRDLMDTNGLHLPEGFGRLFMKAMGSADGLKADKGRAKAAARRFVSSAFGQILCGDTHVFHEVGLNGGLWDTIGTIASRTPGSLDERIRMRTCMGVDPAYMAEISDGEYADMLAMYIWAHDLIAAVGDYGRKHGFLPRRWRGGLIFNGTAEDLAIWMSDHYGWLPDDADERLNDETCRMRNDDGTVSLTLQGAVLQMPDCKPNFGASFKPVLTVRSQERGSEDLPWV